MIGTLTALFERDLNKLIEEINLYKNEEDLWRIKEGISNSAGNLALHVAGGLKHFIGAILGNTAYVRQRDKEFSQKNIPREQIIEDLKKTIEIIENSLSILTEEDIEKDFPVYFNIENPSTSYVLLYLLTHVSYHLGQVNYHRRLLS
ncbi:MAG: DinB family protein [Ginsengibacter sp.]